MPLPTPAKSYTYTTNQRVTGATVEATIKTVWRAIKDRWKLGGGVTVKGSSNGVTAAMDGVDRIAADTDMVRGGNATTAQSWIVLKSTGMGGGEVLIALQGTSGTQVKVTFSPGGLYTLAGTPTFQPTATDEQALVTGLSYEPVTTLGDRIVNAAVATDGSVMWALVARAGNMFYFVYIGACVSAVQSPATFTNPMVAYAQSDSVAANFNEIADFITGATWRALVNGVSLLGFGGAEGYKSNAGPASFTQQALCELQGGAYLVLPLSVWSETAGAKGKVCNVVDLWAGPVVAAHGDTLPNDTSRQFIMAGDAVLKWDGSIPVLA